MCVCFSYTCTHILFLKLFSINGYYKILTIVPCVCVCAVTQSCPTLCDLWTVACQTPLSIGFSRQEYWSGLPCPPQRIFLTQESNPYRPCLLHCMQVLSHWATWEAHSSLCYTVKPLWLVAYPFFKLEIQHSVHTKSNKWNQNVINFKNIYLGLCQVFAAEGAFSNCVEQGLLSSCSVWASHCGGYSLWSTGSSRRAQ